MMKSIRIITMAMAMLVSMSMMGQNPSKAKEILDKTAANLNSQGGAQADFTLSSDGVGSISGTIFIKGKKFHATTPKASIWFDGKTQWTYMKSSDEVNVSTPNESQQAQMNPYKFITLYKNGYRLGVKEQGNVWEVHLTALNRGRSIQEMYVYVSKSYLPTKVRLLEDRKWSEISIRNFKNSPQPDSMFTFNAKDFPEAEVIDLR
ncbi:MAG: outer-membrane lipoprotein carrier protein LolA [Prevotella sp.]|nr:outer-membrane lipoprotein carrier protein LolA [Prevotella sp.]